MVLISGDRSGDHPRNQALKATHYLGKASWKRLSGYHKRSLVETKMHCIKRLGERVMSRRFDRQVAELTIRAAILNQFTLLGRPHTIRVSCICGYRETMIYI